MSRIGRYEIIEPLGTGAMGRVYKAYDTVLEREVALKTINTGTDTPAELRQRFQREARACARLRHPNIITVYDLGESEGLSYIAMELLTGSDFRRLIQERREVPLDRQIQAGVQICEALAFAHREGVVHRDIKPSNLFLTDEGCAKILDFGIAHLPASNLTIRGQVLGTPKYMAPEQIQGRPSDGRSDLFSFAVVLFEWLSGVHPFQGPSAPQRILHGEPETLRTHAPEMPEGIERILARGLEKDPELRYTTGDEFAKDLRAVLESLPRMGSQGPVFSMTRPVDPAGDAPTETLSAARPAAPAAPAVAVVECPPGQDPEEWRLSEALRLLPEFEAAVERRDIPSAQKLLADLEGRLEGDIRFAEALRLARQRMPLPPDPAPEVNRAAAAVERPLAPVKSEPSRPVGVDDTIFGNTMRPEPVRPAPAPPAAPSPVAAPPLPPEPRQTSPPPLDTPPPRRGQLFERPEERPPERRPEIKAAPAPPPQRVQAQAASTGKRRTLIVVGGLLVCGAVLAVGAYFYLQPATLEKAVATAVVGPGEGKIYRNPSPEESVVATAPAGGQVNVLSLPAHRRQEWTRVQMAVPSVSRPGYIRTSAIREWHAQTAAGALAIVRLTGTGESGTAEEMEAQADQLSDVAGRFPADAAARQARLEAVRLRLAAARSEKNAGQPPAAWTPFLKKAQDDLAVLNGDPQMRDAALDLSQQVAAMLASAIPPDKHAPAPGRGGKKR